MINNIVDIFRQQAREHKSIKSFYYSRNYELGSGNEAHPLCWLEDPIHGKNQDNTFTNSTSFSILFTPQKDKSIIELQNLAFSIGLNIIERIKKNKDSNISIKPDWTYTTLRDYYDNNTCGCRFSINFVQVNMQDKCLIEEQFEKEKQFEIENLLNDFTLSATNGCEVFIHKLPDFDIKTTNR